MFEALKQIFQLIKKTDKIWLLPIFLGLVIAALLIISSQISPIPAFIYPVI